MGGKAKNQAPHPDESDSKKQARIYAYPE